MQGQLIFADNGQTIAMVDVPISHCQHSRFNTRKTRSDKDIEKLAQRMREHGFERTRALWSVAVNEHYEVFAGGTRLEAAKLAGFETVPLMLHQGYTDDAISRRADVDNENDEYHAKVPLPDEWAEYLRLHDEENWSQERIGLAKNCHQTAAGNRIEYARFPDEVLEVFKKHDFLREVHAAELSELRKFLNLEPWLTRETSLQEILTLIVGPNGTHRGGSAGQSPTADTFRKHVKTYNGMIEAAQAALKGFPADVADEPRPFKAQEAFLQALAKKHVRTTKDVIAEARLITAELEAIEARHLARIEAEQRRLTEAQEAAAREALRLQLERLKAERLERLLSTLQHGDCRALIPEKCPDGIALLLTDPPYGKQFQSNRRVVTGKKSVMAGDWSLAEATQLLDETLAAIQPKLLADAHLFIFTHQDSYEAFLSVLYKHGFIRRRTMTWVKGNHGMGDVTGGESLLQTEWIIHAVQGNPKLTEGVERPELLEFAGDQDSEHPAEKPPALLQHLISRGTEPGALVVDPFAGTANTLVASFLEGRRGWACEQDEGYYRSGAEKLYRFVTEREA